ncbi:MAG: hypothetical protein WBO70_00875 [Erysipelotrichaceae bacterium]
MKILKFINFKLIKVLAIDVEAFKKLIKDYTSDVSNILYGVIGGVMAISIVLTIIKYFMQDEDDRQKSQLVKNIRNILIAGVFAVVVPVVISLLGI